LIDGRPAAASALARIIACMVHHSTSASPALFTCDTIHPSNHGSDIQTLRSHCASPTILLTPTHTTVVNSQSSTRSQSFLRIAKCTSYSWLDAQPLAGPATERHHIDGRYRASQVVGSVTWRKSCAHDTAELQPGRSSIWRNSYCQFDQHVQTSIHTDAFHRAA
jgi:hypothetical protein